MPLFAKDGNCLTYRFDAEKLRIEPWGENSLRVRSTKDAEIPKATLAYACYDNSVSKAGQIFLEGLKEFCKKLGGTNE